MPTVPGGDVREGGCWTESIAVTRSGAWRCMVNNGISDPCFAIPEKRDQLVCGADPARKQLSDADAKRFALNSFFDGWNPAEVR